MLKIFSEKVGAMYEMYEMISKKVMEVGVSRVLYELKMKGGKKQILTLDYTVDDEMLEETREMLFCQAKNNDILTVVKDGTKKSRDRAPSEA